MQGCRCVLPTAVAITSPQGYMWLLLVAPCGSGVTSFVHYEHSFAAVGHTNVGRSSSLRCDLSFASCLPPPHYCCLLFAASAWKAPPRASPREQTKKKCSVRESSFFYCPLTQLPKNEIRTYVIKPCAFEQLLSVLLHFCKVNRKGQIELKRHLTRSKKKETTAQFLYANIQGSADMSFNAIS